MLCAPCTVCNQPTPFNAFATWVFGDPLCSETCHAGYVREPATSVGSADVVDDRRLFLERVASLRGFVPILEELAGRFTEDKNEAIEIAMTSSQRNRADAAERRAEQHRDKFQNVQFTMESHMVAAARRLMALHAHGDPVVDLALSLVKDHGGLCSADPYGLWEEFMRFDVFLAGAQQRFEGAA